MMAPTISGQPLTSHFSWIPFTSTGWIDVGGGSPDSNQNAVGGVGRVRLEAFNHAYQ